jgi:membrane-bound lytic murein transglycosylase D
MQKIALALVIICISGCAHVAPPTPQPPQTAATHAHEMSATDIPDAPLAVQQPPSAPPDAAAGAEALADPEPVAPVLTLAPFSAVPEASQPQDIEAPRTLWARVVAGFALPPVDNDLVRAWERWYAARPDYVERMVERGSHFLFHIVEEVEKRGMPTEIALLPMIESAYNPLAYSSAHASGIWQFIPSTGKHYGLRQTWWYDGRRDVIAATDAALDYLEKLHRMFGDWELALASYNWGEGAVSRALERNRERGRPEEYEHLTLPDETRSYIPKLIAVKNIISDPGRFGLEIQDVPNEPYFETITLRRHIDVNLAAKLAEIPVDEFRFLNPGHNKPVIRAGEAERIVLPRGKAATFKRKLKKYDRPLVSWNTVRLRRGQKATLVAEKHGMTLGELKRANGLTHHRRIVPGQLLLVRVEGGVANPHLPDVTVRPVPLHRAVRAARSKASTRSAQRAEARRVTSQPRARNGPRGKARRYAVTRAREMAQAAGRKARRTSSSRVQAARATRMKVTPRKAEHAVKAPLSRSRPVARTRR